MQEVLYIALACTLVAALPLRVSGRKLLINPAFFLFLMVVWSVLLKSVYLALYHSEPYRTGHDRVFVNAESADFLITGAWLLLVAISSYTVAFFLVGARRPGEEWLRARALRLNRRGGRRALAVLGLLALAAFLVYVQLADQSLFEMPFSAKRFKPARIGVETRFQYLPYYFFKLALLSGSLVYGAAFFLARAENRRQEFSRRWLFSAVFLLALLLAHYASLRLFILLVLLQVALLAHYLLVRRLRPLLGLLAAMTVASFITITYFHRAQTEPEPGMPEAEEVAELPSEEPITAPEIEEVAAGGGGEPTAIADPEARAEAGTEIAEEVRSRRESVARFLARAGRSFGFSSFDGRYFLDVAKMAHIGRFFPDERDFVGWEGLVGRSGVAPATASTERPWTVSLGRYLAVEVFSEPNNNIPAGYTGELYLSFGPLGLILGFLALGALHRWLFNLLAARRLAAMTACCLILLIPNTTIVLLNSNLLAAAARSVLDFGVLIAFWRLTWLIGSGSAIQEEEGSDAISDAGQEKSPRQAGA